MESSSKLYWEHAISDLLLIDHWSGLLIQVFPRVYNNLNEPRFSLINDLPVLELPQRIDEGLDPVSSLSRLLKDIHLDQVPEDENDSFKSEAIKAFLVNYFGKIDLLGLDIDVKWTSLFNENQKRLASIDWRRIFESFISSFGKTRSVFSNRRYSKRYGTIPGKLLKNSLKFAFVLDVSASMNYDLLKQFFLEMDIVLSKGSQIDLFQVDDRIRSIEPYRSGMHIEIAKGGNTNFNTAIDYIEKTKTYDGLIICTDGMLQQKPSSINIKHLWVLDEEKQLPFEINGPKAFLSYI